MAKHTNDKTYSCPVELTIGVIGGKWKSVILYHLMKDKIIRFGVFKKLLPKVTAQMLTAQLRELEADGIINRKIYKQVPPKVEYSLTDFGESLAPIIKAMNKWGTDYAKDSGKDISFPKKS